MEFWRAWREGSSVTAGEREALRRAIDARRRELEADERFSAVKTKRAPDIHKRPRVVSTHSASGYKNGCRCDVCREANRVYEADRTMRASGATGERAVKVAAILAIRAGRPDLHDRERAEILGMKLSAYRNLLDDPDGSKQRARRASYRGVCGRCGGVTRSDGTSKPSAHCVPCAAELARVWTRKAVIDAIRRFAVANGRPPTSRDWSRPGRGEGYPAVGSVSRSGGHASAPFESWSDAIEAAGFPRPVVGRYQDESKRGSKLRIWTRTNVLAAIRQWAGEHGGPPSQLSWRTRGPWWPCFSTVDRLFGTWNSAIAAAGFEPTPRGGRRRVSA